MIEREIEELEEIANLLMGTGDFGLIAIGGRILRIVEKERGKNE